MGNVRISSFSFKLIFQRDFYLKAECFDNFCDLLIRFLCKSRFAQMSLITINVCKCLDFFFSLTHAAFCVCHSCAPSRSVQPLTCFTSSWLAWMQWPCQPAQSRRLHWGQMAGSLLCHQRILHTNKSTFQKSCLEGKSAKKTIRHSLIDLVLPELRKQKQKYGEIHLYSLLLFALFLVAIFLDVCIILYLVK